MKPISFKMNLCIRLSLRRILSIVFLLFHFNAWMVGQVPGWTWAKSFGGAGSTGVFSNAVSSINGGAVYTLGTFGGEMDIDPGTDTILVNSGAGNDLFIIKQNEAGEFIWGRTVGGTENITGTIIAISEVRGESVYVAGQFSGTVDFDPGPNVFTIESAGKDDIFILKLDSNGIFLWAKSMGGNGNDRALSLAVDPQEGFVYTTGSYQDTSDFNPGPPSYLLQAVGLSDIFISKLDENGFFVWAKSIGGFGNDWATSIAIDPASGEVYATGTFLEAADFDPGSGSFIMYPDASTFILKLNSAGSFVWAKQIENTFTHGRSIAVDSTGIGSVYLAGAFTGSTDFDPGANIFTMNSTGGHDIFILKIATTGDFIWAKQIGGEEYQFCVSIIVPYANNGDIYITGSFAGSCDFDPGSNVFMLTSTGGSDIFISRLNNQGDLKWAVAIGGYEWDWGASIALDVNSTTGPFIAGYFNGNVDFDPGQGTFNLANGNVFNLSLDTTGMFEWANTLIIEQFGRALGNEIAMNPASGISVSVGEFYGKVDFDPGSGTQIKIAEGAEDIFLTCLDALGQWSWTKTIACIDGHIDAKSLRIDPFDQSIYLIGQFSGTIDFDPGSGIHYASAPYNEYETVATFILKLSVTGQFLWVRTVMGDYNGNNCLSNEGAIDGCGHLYITGVFSYGTIDFDPGPTQFLMTTSESSGYLLKLDTLGHFIWAKRIGIELPGSGCGASANSIAVSPKSESMYICGIFAGTCYLDESGSTHTTGPEFDFDLFIAKLDSSGLIQWVKTIGDPYKNDEVVSICTDRNSEKNIYLLGSYDGQVDFDPDTGTHILFTNNGSYDVFLLKLDSLGRFIWVDGFGGLMPEVPLDMTVDTFGQVIYLIGWFFENMDADPSYSVESLVSLGSEDLFFISIDESGNLKYAEAIGTPTYDFYSAGLSHHSGARVLLIGTFDYPNLSLGSLLIENAGAPGNEDAFIGMYEGCMGVVINTFDNGFGSLRREVDCASSGDTIIFDITLPNEITLTSGEISIQKNLTISGPGFEQLSISGNNISRIFNLGEYSFGLKGLTLKQAASPSLGGAMLLQGQASLENVRLEQNFENGLPKALSLIYPGELIVNGNVEIKF